MLARNIIKFPRRPDRQRDFELAFLPAALEISETPPSPIGRAISLTIVALFCFALVWASLGHVDIVASATGKIVPSERTKVIQPLEIGIVRAIRVQDGQAVKAGDVLIELDPTERAADQEHLRNDLTSAQLDVARLHAALAYGTDPLLDFHPPENASPTQIEMQRQFLISQTAEQRAKLAAIDRQRMQKEAELETVKATIAKLDATLPMLQERSDVRKYLYARELGSKLTYLTEFQDLVSHQKDIEVQKSRLREVDAALSGLDETRTQAQAEYRRTLFTQLDTAEQKAAGLAQDLLKASARARFQVLRAPEDGVVQQLSVHTIGGVVTPAQPLLAVVPADSRLEVEAMISNRDVGFINAGQPVEIKVDTFNFTKYGLLHGRVMSVSSDAITRNKPPDRQGDSGLGIGSGTSEPTGQELIYSARIALDRTGMQIDGRSVNLTPGMAVTAEIKTGTRRIIGYLLSPFMKYGQESLRER